MVLRSRRQTLSQSRGRREPTKKTRQNVVSRHTNMEKKNPAFSKDDDQEDALCIAVLFGCMYGVYHSHKTYYMCQ